LEAIRVWQYGGELNAYVSKHGISGKYDILPFGMDDKIQMTEAGVTEGSIDAIVYVHPCFPFSRKSLVFCNRYIMTITDVFLYIQVFSTLFSAVGVYVIQMATDHGWM